MVLKLVSYSKKIIEETIRQDTTSNRSFSKQRKCNRTNYQRNNGAFLEFKVMFRLKGPTPSGKGCHPHAFLDHQGKSFLISDTFTMLRENQFKSSLVYTQTYYCKSRIDIFIHVGISLFSEEGNFESVLQHKADGSGSGRQLCRMACRAASLGAAVWRTGRPFPGIMCSRCMKAV